MICRIGIRLDGILSFNQCFEKDSHMVTIKLLRRGVVGQLVRSLIQLVAAAAAADPTEAALAADAEPAASAAADPP